ncbi:uncharacterized protein LY89DRAFT_249366 [Mollisia scopiformis]|uniref:Mid2 domain-containing protein n=1 Tax=Mollisia scopiformis TaxID=149040 RepID=A0A194WRV4_MOLSC|nr:uncharacterized protein LY89DRAFT_249366 [Mollisia scopiformis]KUJ10711.1 hypothetical protein LY89DRAFT_249366 [Mollisia scopiformis]
MSTGTLAAAGPLTTTFTPSPACTNDFYTAPTYYSIGGPLASTCFPSGWASTSQYFSPGVCPEGYTQACASISASETFATCCPSGYVCYTPTIFNFVGQACASVFTSQITTTVTDGSALTVLLATLHTKTEAVNGYGVSIRYNANDFATSSSSSSAPTTSSSSGSSTSNSASSATTSPPASPSTTASSGLSTGAKAGIGIGIAAVGLLALVALGFFIMKKRRRALPDYTVHEADGIGKQGWDGQPKVHKVSSAVHEVFTPPSELDGNSPRGAPEVYDGSNFR